MKALIVGVTGLVGRALLDELLAAEGVERVEAWSRSPLGVVHPKLTVKLISPEHLTGMEPTEATDVFCCLGTTIRKAGSREAFRRVDFGMVADLCNYAASSGCRSFNVISSVGADARSRNFYLRTKGEMEEAVIRSGIPSVVIVRPSLLVGKRREFRFGEEMAKLAMFGLEYFMVGSMKQYRPVKATAVAHALYRLAGEEQSGLRIVHWDEIVKR